MSSANSVKSSRRSHSSLSCVCKRPDSSIFDSRNTEPPKVIKRPTIGIVNNDESQYNHRGSGATLDDASSLVDQSSSAVSPARFSSKFSSGTSVSQSDLFGINHKPTTLTITQRESIHVRALFRYDPSTDRGLAARGLAFEHGDILYVVNASDPEWWQACYAFPVSSPAWASSSSSNNFPSETPPALRNTTNHSLATTSSSGRLAIIPSQRRVERRNRIASKRVKFVDKDTDLGGGNPSPWSLAGGEVLQQHHYLEGNRFFSGDGGSSSSLSAMGGSGDNSFPIGDSASIGGTLDRRKKPNSFSIFKRFSSKRDRKDLDVTGGTLKKKSISLEDMQTGALGTRLSRTYEIVHPVTLQMARPLILFGPLKERITEELLRRPNEFATCIQHTSRPPQTGERDGVDYHFYESKVAMQADIASGRFLEVVVQNDHFYATSLQSVVEVLQSGRICILDVNIMTIYRLQTAGLRPIAILLKPETVMQWRGLQRRLTVDQARRMHEACSRMESEHWYLFTAILNLESLDSAIASVNRILQQHRGPRVWLPADRALSNVDKHLRPAQGN